MAGRRAHAAGTIRWEGLQELYKALRQLPDELATEAAGIIEHHAFEAAHEIQAAYPYGTAGRYRKGEPIEPGNLKLGMDVSRVTHGRWGVDYLVINRAKHAYIYEHGTTARHYFTVHGVKKLVGQMPVRPTFIPRIVKWRRRMEDELAALLERHGLLVTGRAA